MNTMADTLNQLRKYGLTSNIDLENKIQKKAISRQKTLDKIKDIEKDLNEIYTAIEALNILNLINLFMRSINQTLKIKNFMPNIKLKLSLTKSR